MEPVARNRTPISDCPPHSASELLLQLFQSVHRQALLRFVFSVLPLNSSGMMYCNSRLLVSPSPSRSWSLLMTFQFTLDKWLLTGYPFLLHSRYKIMYYRQKRRWRFCNAVRLQTAAHFDIVVCLLRTFSTQLTISTFLLPCESLPCFCSLREHARVKLYSIWCSALCIRHDDFGPFMLPISARLGAGLICEINQRRTCSALNITSALGSSLLK